MTTLTLDHTVRSYAGYVGCMCGCKGSYTESDRSRKAAITHMRKNKAAVELLTWGRDSTYIAGCLTVDINGRTRALYLTTEGVAAAVAEGFA